MAKTDIYDVGNCYELIDAEGVVAARYSKPLSLMNRPGQNMNWEEKFNILDGSNVVWKRIRQERNKLLSETDWTQIPDCTINKQVWLDYRNALRNLPQNFSNPHQVVWPTKPA